MLAGFTVFENKEDIKLKIKIIAGLTEKENVRWKLDGIHKTKLENCDWEKWVQGAVVKSFLGWLLILHMESELQSEEETMKTRS